jgi:hypothetical protein
MYTIIFKVIFTSKLFFSFLLYLIYFTTKHADFHKPLSTFAKHTELKKRSVVMQQEQICKNKREVT